jgi:hypothetical protein
VIDEIFSISIYYKIMWRNLNGEENGMGDELGSRM